ncbi:MAG: hypothetical protein HY053_00435 [Proteobacteria bacterium]|nr:hypothetical protein [Pseudomonadota bacterium]
MASRFSFLRFLLPLALLAPLGGCIWLGEYGSLDEDVQAPTPDEQKLAEMNRFPYEGMAPEAPPPPPMEFQPPQPSPGDEYAWRPGHFEYVDLKGYVWHGGYWIRKPAFTAVWKPDFWIHHTYGWSLVPGHWE